MYFERGKRLSPIMPEVLLRVGRKILHGFLNYNYGFNFPTSMPVLMNELSIVSGIWF